LRKGRRGGRRNPPKRQAGRPGNRNGGNPQPLVSPEGAAVSSHGAQARGTRTGVSPFFLSAPSGRLRRRLRPWVQSPLWGSKQRRKGGACASVPRACAPGLLSCAPSGLLRPVKAMSGPNEPQTGRFRPFPTCCRWTLLLPGSVNRSNLTAPP